MKFDKEIIIPKVFKAYDCLKEELLVGDMVIGAIGTNDGYIFKGKIIRIQRDLIEVESEFYRQTRCKRTFKVAPKRVRGMKYEKDNL